MARYKRLHERRTNRASDQKWQQFKQHAARERLRGSQHHGPS